MDGGFLVNLDSVAQRETYDHSPEKSLDELTGVLRVGCLLTGTLLLTDTQVLDGILMLTIEPRGLRNRIGEAFHILAREHTLEQSLAAFLDRGGPTLAQFEFSSLPGLGPDERIEVGRRLAEFPATEFREVRNKNGAVAAVCHALIACGVSEDKLQDLSRYWSSWIEADRDGELRIVKRPYQNLNMAEQATRKPLGLVLTSEGSPVAIDHIMKAVERSAHRSEIRYIIETLGLSESDTISAREWLDTVYICAVAKHYGVLAVELPRSSVERLARRRSPDEAGLMLSVQSVQKLSNVRVATFEIIYDKTRDDAKKWLESKKERHIRQLASTIDRDTTTDSNLRREGLKSAARLAVVASAIQVSSVFNHNLITKILLALGTVILTELVPVVYRNLFPKGELTATIDPLSSS